MSKCNRTGPRPELKSWILVALVIVCSSITASFAGEIGLHDARLALTLPETWRQVSETRTGILVRAEYVGADGGRARFMLTRPPLPSKPERVQSASFQDGVKRSLRDNGFPKIVRSEVVTVAGADAYLCEAMRDDKPHSTLQVAWFHEGVFHSLVFASMSKPLKDVPGIQSIIGSMRALSGVTATITDFGIYRVSGDRRSVEYPTIPNKTIWWMKKESVVFEQRTNVIPGVLNTHFGLAFQVSGLPPRAKTNVNIHMTWPEIQSPDGRKSTGAFWPKTLVADENGNATGFTGYTFDEKYEIAPGLWKMGVSIGGKKMLLLQSFTVREP